jgi:hypothetical protein
LLDYIYREESPLGPTFATVQNGPTQFLFRLHGG